MMLGKIKSIEEVLNFKTAPIGKIKGENNSRLGMIPMLNSIGGFAAMDGYKIETDKHIYHVLIDNGQSCCEDWGYLSSEDNFNNFIGSELREVNLTDTALNTKTLEKEIPYGLDGGGIQFVDFVTDKGVFQLAVYNSHNGYYGHGIVIGKDGEVLLNDTL